MSDAPQTTAYPDDYLAGIQLFNEQHFWHAHEQWEACWLKTQDPEARFYKGIIQSAAALVKWQQGNLYGMRLNWAKSQSRLAGLPSPFLGLDVDRFCRMMQQFVEAQSQSQPAPVPVIELDPQPRTVP
jgi:hypothetical protein